ncbi:MAG: thioredoxin family protein [Pseudomonadota bacterium]
MQRRTFLAASAAATATLALPKAAMAIDWVDYTPGLIDQLLGEGKVVLVDYAADWCSTCARQARVISDLVNSNPAYSALAYVRVDWDDFKSHPVTKARGVPRRSTLLVLKGDQELGRLVAETRKGQIQSLLDTGLAASTA